MRNQMRREWWRVLMLVGGAIWAVSLLPMVFWGQRILAYNAPDIKEDVLVAAAIVLMIGWLAVPLLITGLDDTLDPGRFATFGVSARRIMPGLAIAAFLTIPAIFTVLVVMVLASSWRTEGGGALAVALVGAALTAVVFVFSARLMVMWAARILASGRARLVALVSVIGVLALVAPAAWVVFNDGFELVLEYDLRTLLEAVARTPVGAGMAAPAAAADGRWLVAIGRLAMVAAWVVLLLAGWRSAVNYTLVHPVFRGSGVRRTNDAILAAASAHRTGGPSRVMLSQRARTVRARLLRYWATDPRYVAGAVGVLAFPVLFLALVIPTFGLEARWALLVPVLLAASVGWGRHNDVALDSSALWIDIVSGSNGRDIMRGRVGAIARWSAPAVLIAAVAVLAWTGLWEYGGALFGTSVGVLGATLGVAALTSVILPYRAPGPGENPFGAEVGSVGAGLVAQLASSASTFLVLPLVTLPFILALTVDPRWGAVGGVAGLILGPAAYLAGAHFAGRLYDRRSGRLIGAVS